jgi:hypothetical protein
MHEIAHTHSACVCVKSVALGCALGSGSSSRYREGMRHLLLPLSLLALAACGLTLTSSLEPQPGVPDAAMLTIVDAGGVDSNAPGPDDASVTVEPDDSGIVQEMADAGLPDSGNDGGEDAGADLCDAYVRNGAEVPDSVTDKPHFSYGGHCYWLGESAVLAAKAKTFSGINAPCGAHRGYLVVVSSDAENTQIVNRLRTGLVQDPWSGVVFAPQALWLSSASNPVDLTKVVANGQGQCSVFRSNGKWEQASCYTAHQPICERIYAQ